MRRPLPRLARPARAGWAACLLPACLAAAWLAPGLAVEPEQGASIERDRAGHRRMVELLEQIRAESQETNAYLGDGPIERLSAELETLPQEATARRWSTLMQLGEHELRIGREEQALARYAQALALIDGAGQQGPPDKRLETLFALGVAHTRVGETRNCAQRHTSDSCILPIRGGGIHEETEPSEQAARYFLEVAEAAATHSELYHRARWLLNIAAMTLGRYPEGVPEPHRIAPGVFASEEEFPRFVDVAPAAGLNAFDLSGGAVIEDLDGDGLLDVLVSTSDTAGPMRLWRNVGDGSFEERAGAAGLSGLLGGLNMAAADYDNDGDTDVLVLRGGWYREGGRHPNSLLRNDGDGSFTDVTFVAGLGAQHYPTQTASWADYDLDGDLDLYIGNEHQASSPAPGQLFRNDGNGTFTDVAPAAGVENRRYAKGVAWGDYDKDGDPDLYVSNLGDRNRLYRNNGDGTFTDVAERLGVSRPLHSFATWFWDFDNDGALDLFVAAYGGVMHRPDLAAVAASYLGLPHRAETARLYRGDGRGGFREVAAAQNLRRVTLPMGANWGDLDNDGYPDFYLGTGYPAYDGLMPNVMYRNRGGTGFADVTTDGGFGHLQKGHAVVFADLDNDGDQDVYEQLGGAYPGDAFGNALFENPGFGRHWIKIRLVGRESNRSGIGARIRIEVADGDGARAIVREAGRGGSFGANPRRQEIGLGAAERIERLEIRWPASGTSQSFEGVEVDRMIEITEGRDEIRTVPLRRFTLRP